MGENFALLADSTSLDIVRDPFLHSWPSEACLYFPKCFIPARMPHGGVIMMRLEYSPLYFNEGWNRNLSIGMAILGSTDPFS